MIKYLIVIPICARYSELPSNIKNLSFTSLSPVYGVGEKKWYGSNFPVGCLVGRRVTYAKIPPRRQSIKRGDFSMPTFTCLKSVRIFIYQVILAYNNIFYLRKGNKFSISFTITLPAVKSVRAKSSFCFHITASEDSERTDPPFRI